MDVGRHLNQKELLLREQILSCKSTTPGSESKLQPVECNYLSYSILDLPSDTDPRKNFYGLMVKLCKCRKGFGAWGGDGQISTTCWHSLSSHPIYWYDMIVAYIYRQLSFLIPNTRVVWIGLAHEKIPQVYTYAQTFKALADYERALVSRYICLQKGKIYYINKNLRWRSAVKSLVRLRRLA